MTSLSVKQLFKVSFCTFGLIAFANKAIAQITPDNTVNTQVTQNGNVSEITGGEARGSNLFHSFQDFSVGTGNQAFFNNATDIGNIFSRVTGGNVSNINGAIRANGGANLFLINPAGILFGEGASLNIGGSFYGSSASSILFDDGEFSAIDPQNPPLLTVNAPIGLNFRDEPSRVAVQGTNLRVESGQTLGLIGGEVSIENGNLNALGSTVNLGAVSAAGTVTIDENFNLDFTDLPLADISLNNALVNVNGNGGAIAVNARNLNLSQASSLNAGIDSADSTAQTQGGDITINASENVSLESDSAINNNIRPNSAGNTGDIQVTANNLAIADNSRLSIISQGTGNTGDINVNVAEEISLNRTGQIKSQILENGVGEGGDINIDSTSLTLTDLTSTQTSAVFTDLFGRGKAGDINITASDRISLEGSNFQTSVVAGAVGDAGNIDIATNSLQLTSDVQGNPSQLIAETAGQGNAGNIIVNATNVGLENSSIFITQVQPGGLGDAGNIEISTENLSLTTGVQNAPTALIANTEGNGNAGNITINATENINADGFSSILSQVRPGAEGNGGNINLSANSLDVSQFQLIANTRSRGDAGSVTLNIAEDTRLDRGSLIASQVRSEMMEVEGVGEAGDINITTGSLELNNSLIVADSSGLGSSGDINIIAEDTITLQGLPTTTRELGATLSELPSQITTGLDDFINPDTGVVESSGQGEAGSINITASQLNLTDLASISSNVEENTVGSGGEVVLNADSISLDSNAAVGTFTSSRDEESNAGSITINSENLELASGGRLSSGTDGAGDAGTISLNISDRLTIDGAGAENAPTLVFNNAITNDLLGRTGLFANATERSTGNASAGSILIGQNPNLSPQDITLANGAEIRVNNQAQGNAGNIAIATDSLSLNSNGVISAENAAGEGGNIDITTSDRITLKDDSLISSAATNSANGGNVTIDTNFIVAFPTNNDILASAEQGQGGNIKITAESLFGIQERDGNNLRMNLTNDINASSEVTGLDGTVTIETPDLNPAEEVSQLPNNVAVPQEVAAQACNANAAKSEENRLIVRGKGGIPRSPESPMDSENLIVKGEMIDVASADFESQSITTSYGEITPARGVKVTEDGKVILTAYRTDQSDRIPHSSRNCQ